MTCRDARENYGDPSAMDHAAQCPSCRDDFEAMQRVEAALTPARKVLASSGFKERVMRAAVVEEKSRLWFPKWAWVACAAAVLLLVLPMISRREGPATVLADSLKTWSDVRSVHLTGRMRSIPNDNFEYIDLNAEFIPVELWKDFGAPERWRIEKPGRVVVMDGYQTTMLIAGNRVVKAGRNNGFVEWLKPLLDADTVLRKEMEAIRFETASATLRGDSELVVSRKAQGDFRNAWTRNKAIVTSDHTCVYRFDPATKRLVGLEVIVHAGGKDVTVLAIDAIRYNEPFDPALFALTLPEQVIETVGVRDMPKGAVPLPKNPRETAERLFEAFERKDWTLALTVMPDSEVSPKMKEIYGGLTLISLGEPFQSGIYPGWFVPYEVELPSGRVKKFNLAVRNDNRERRWLFDGGM